MVKEDYRIFVGGLSWDVTERQLERAFARFGKVLECQIGLEKLLLSADLVGAHLGSYGRWLDDLTQCLSDYTKRIMLERDTGRPRGFGFITYADRRGMEDAIREMHGREFGDRVISVNKAQPKLGDDIDPGYRGGYSSGGRGNYGGDRPAAQDECFKCGRLGHWARDCPSAGGGRGGGGPPLSHSRYGGGGGGGGRERFGGERDRYIDDRYDGGRYGDRDRFDSRDLKYAGHDRYTGDRYPTGGDRFASDRYGASDRYPQNGFGKDRGYDRDAGPRAGGDRYASGGPLRTEDRSYRNRGPYDRPSRGGRPSSFERY